MTLILTFNADFYTLVNRDRVEKIQMKYIMILQRYLRYNTYNAMNILATHFRSKFKAENSNTKFLEAMLLIAQARQAWEISSENLSWPV